MSSTERANDAKKKRLKNGIKPANSCFSIGFFFDGCERHHLTKTIVINLPSFVHRSIYHSHIKKSKKKRYLLKKGKHIKPYVKTIVSTPNPVNMPEINGIAIQYLLGNWLYLLRRKELYPYRCPKCSQTLLTYKFGNKFKYCPNCDKFLYHGTLHSRKYNNEKYNLKNYK